MRRYKLMWLLIIFLMLFVHSTLVEIVRKRPGKCELDETCVCIPNSKEYVLHCEGNLHVNVQHEALKAKFACNKTIPSVALNRDYYSLLKLDSFQVSSFTFVECPQPTHSYSSLFWPHSKLLSTQNDTVRMDLRIVNIEIVCGARIDFNIEKKDFEGLNYLSLLRIQCPVLSVLPNDLFYEPLPNLFYLEITENRIDYIPEMFFSRLENLRHLVFTGSQVKRLQKHSLVGPKSLQKINLSENKLELIEDDAFDNHAYVTEINFSKNNITFLPKSLERLYYLERLNLQQNSMRNFTFDDCSDLSSMQSIILRNNMITEVDLPCLSLMDQLVSIDISGNNIIKFSDTPITLDSIDDFIWNHNSVNNFHLGEFLKAKSLSNLILSNSSISSFHPKLLHSLQKLVHLDLSWNNIDLIPQDTFSQNYDLRNILLQGNMLSTLPPGIFKNNQRLMELRLSLNNISILNASIFPNNSQIHILDISHNIINEIPENFLFELRSVNTVNISFNKIKSLPKNLFNNTDILTDLDISHNLITSLPTDIFLPLKENTGFLFLNMQDNKLFSLPDLAFPKLRSLNLAGNRLQRIPERVFHKLPVLEQLDLSRNLIKYLHSPLILPQQILLYVDLSSNKIQEIPESLFSSANNLRELNLSGNNITKFNLESITGTIKLYNLNLSNNSMSFIGVFSDRSYRESVRRQCYGVSEGLYCKELLQSCPVKVLNLSHNNLNFNYTEWKYNEAAKTWGRVSPLIYCKNAEEIYLNDNFIDEIFLDWRVDFPFLRRLDLRHNKISHLSHQEQLFSAVNIHDNGTISPYACSSSVVVDLQENLINGVELPESMLSVNPGLEKTEGIYRQTTFLLGHNPFTCNCGLLNILRVVSNDVVLTSEIERRTGKKWMMSARLDVENLRCWLPKTVQGKKIKEPEEWIHHILPMIGLCSLENQI